MVIGDKMKVQPMWGECDLCNGKGRYIQRLENGQTQNVSPCPKCHGNMKIRTDSLHRSLGLERNDFLVDLSLSPPMALECAFDKPRSCGSLCPAFSVKTSETGDKNYACCARLQGHIIGLIEVEYS
jgi:hypothetical protein